MINCIRNYKSALFYRHVLSGGYRICSPVRSVNDSYDKSIKKFRLLKRLASTVLFGGTFVAVVWSRKYYHTPCKAFDEAKVLKLDSSYHKNFKLYEYKGFVLPIFVMKMLDRIKDFTCREEDIFVVSFPKTGTTWLQEIIYCILEGIDVSKSAAKTMEDKFPYMEFIYPGLSSIEKTPGQRFIKTHLPFSLLPDDVHKKHPKILCIMRNPKDVAVSFYHFIRMLTFISYNGDFETFFNEFLANKVPYGPIWKHYSDIWEHKDDPNVLIVFYEELHRDLPGNIKKIAEFLGKNLSNEEINDIANHCSFSSMSNNPSANYQHWDDLGIRKKSEAKFLRKGLVGDWRNYFTSIMNNQMDMWIEQNFVDSGLSFNYSLPDKDATL